MGDESRASAQVPAIVWSKEWSSGRSNGDSTFGIGCSAVLEDLTASTDACASSTKSTDDLVMISYHNLLRCSRGCAEQMSKLLYGVTKGRDQQPIVGLAIAEGPLLPITVLALHLIQLRFCESATTLRKVPIILPIDPEEPEHRLRQILEDASPDVIVCGIDSDVKKMTSMSETIVKNVSHLLVNESDNASSTALAFRYPWPPQYSEELVGKVVSHICFTSGSSARPKGCTSSLKSLLSYLQAKNVAHDIRASTSCRVFLASSISFDPCFSDILATFSCVESSLTANNSGSLVGATLAIAPRSHIYNSLAACLIQTEATHILCTPTLWSTVSVGPTSLLNLRVIALGGERIQKRIVQRWARKKSDDVPSISSNKSPRLLATYGTTEACVYQTCGEVFSTATEISEKYESAELGQDVGVCLPGNAVRICSVTSDDVDSMAPYPPTVLKDVVETGPVKGLGEIVLAGSQLDDISGYWKRRDLSHGKFFFAIDQDGTKECMHYRTGDIGYRDGDGRLHVLGRIEGEDGMIKINGVRVELGEIESAIIDDESEGGEHSGVDLNTELLQGIGQVSPLVTSCAVVANEYDEGIRLSAYCVLSERCQVELGITPEDFSRTSVGNCCANGFAVPPGSVLYTLLRIRTASKVRKGCVPSNFLIVQKIPMSTTGKCDRKSLPPMECCLEMSVNDSTSNCGDSTERQSLLRAYGDAGPVVCSAVVSALNLPSSTEATLSPSSNFAALGGDSLTAIRVVRALYASHNQINDARSLGGQYGNLEGAFSVKHLLAAPNLGEYVDWLDKNGVCATEKNENQKTGKESNGSEKQNNEGEACITVIAKDHAPRSGANADQRSSSALFEALVNAASSGLSTIAVHLLKAGADPNYAQQNKDQRLGKISDKRERKHIFRSSPLHLACIRGDDVLVAALIQHGAKTKVPDASGGLPLLLNCSACSGRNTIDASVPTSVGTLEIEDDEDQRRLRIARLLLEGAGVPLSAKDANRQTCLHAGARSGHPKLLQYLMREWKKGGDEGKIHIYPEGRLGGRNDWQDRWFRTPVHWSVLNGHVKALEILLRGGCSPNPSRPKASVVKRKTSAAVESPLEICERLYGSQSEKGRQILHLLTSAN